MTDLSTSTSFLISRALGITCSFFLSGYAFSVSHLSIPSIILSPLPLRLAQWRIIYDNGAKISPTMAISSLLLYSYSAYTSYQSSFLPSTLSSSSEWKLHLLAGVLTFSILPYTLLVIMPTNTELIRRHDLVIQGGTEAQDAKFEVESARLVQKWDRLHFVRAVLPLLGGWVGLWTVLR